MFGKWVSINLGEGIECKVFVLCVPSTPDDVLQARAFDQLASRLTQRTADVLCACGKEVATINGVCVKCGCANTHSG